MPKSNVETIIEDYSHWLMLGVTVYRYGGQYIAMICCEDVADKWISHINDENGESEYEFWGLGDSEWFPMASGISIYNAIELLNSKLHKTKQHWDALTMTLRRLAEEPLVRKRISHIKTVDEMIGEHLRWDSGQGNNLTSPRQGFIQ